MSSPLTSGIILKYPLDPTAINPNNKIVEELHELGTGVNRALVPEFSAFYSESLVVWVEDQVEPLVPNEQYIAAQIHADATAALDREVCMIVVITDTTLMGKIRIEYQTVGGNFSVSIDALRQAIEDENLDDRTVSWGDIIAKPSAFAPAPHLHDLGDVYGFEYVVEALEAMRSSILIGDEAIHEELRQLIRHEDDLLRALIGQGATTADTHRTDLTNPHAVTKAQVGLGSVNNFGLATKPAMVTGTSNVLYTTPMLVKDAIDHHALIPLNTHTGRTDNPHGVTKAQAGLGSVQNYPTATKAIMEAGTSSAHYVTPLLVKEAITHHASLPLGVHTSRTDNPHTVTKVQVGLGSVENLALSNELAARNGVSNAFYMTPLRVAQAIETQVLSAFDTFRVRTDNPHSVNKAQVGVGSVENYGIATEAESRAGTVNNKYMTPLRTNQAIATLAAVPLNAHIDNKGNPHAVTKAQVGLGSVENYTTATDAEAIAGVSKTLYMTPHATKQAIGILGGSVAGHSIRNDNPHAVTKAQVGLGSVLDYGVATTVEANAGTVNNKYMTPQTTSSAITSQAVTPLNNHTGRTNNPHNVTKAQVGLGSVLDYGIATKAQAEAGTVNTVYMTPLRTVEAINAMAGPINTHLGRTDNPHNVTKAQVGLSTIPNSITASRTSNTDGTLLTAGGMYDHTRSGDHDTRYAPMNTASVDCSVRVSGSNVYIWAAGAWRQVFPAQWA